MRVSDRNFVRVSYDSAGEEVQPGDAALLRPVPVRIRRRRAEPAHSKPEQPAGRGIHHSVVHLQQRRHHQRQARYVECVILSSIYSSVATISVKQGAVSASSQS